MGNNTGLLDNTHSWVNQYTEMNNSTYNSMEILVDNIIYKSNEFLNPVELEKLNNVLDEVMYKYELLNVKKDATIMDYKSRNDELIDKFLQAKSFEGCSPATIEAYQITITKFLEWVDKGLSEVSSEDVRAYLKYKMDVDNVSNSTADTNLRYLRTTFKWLSDESYIYLNPTTSIPKIKSKKKLKEPFTDMEIEQLRDYLKISGRRKIDCLRNTAIFELLLSSGIRVGELHQLNRKDLDFNERSFIVLGKGDKERKVFFNVKAKKALLEYLNAREDNEEALWHSIRSSNGEHRLGINAIERLLRSAGKKLGFAVHPHKFRRTFATNLLRKGVPLEQVQSLLGHENMETTTLYAVVDDEQVKFNHNRLMD